MPDPEQSILPYLTEDLPGIGGVLKTTMEDFIVEEIPVYAPSGEGDHLFLWVEKRDVSSQYLVKILAQKLNLNPRDIGVAGLKDRRAVTRQFVSVPADCEPLVETFEFDGIKILERTRHERKLKTGHLKGNRFTLVVRDTNDDALSKANAIKSQIDALGFPNYYGTQRMGRDYETVIMGIKLLKNERVPNQYFRNKSLKRLALSAAQSHLFNSVLSERVAANSLHTVHLGEVMQVCESGGIFVVEDQSREQERFDQCETVITGPIFGPKMKQPTDAILEQEQRILAESDLELSHFSRFKKLTPGARRPFLIRPDQFRIEETEAGIQFEFALPSGVYATTLLREFMKQESAVETDDAQ